MLAKQVLSQLSYTPTVGSTLILKHFRPFQNPFLRFSIIHGVNPYFETVFGGRASSCDLPRFSRQPRSRIREAVEGPRADFSGLLWPKVAHLNLSTQTASWLRSFALSAAERAKESCMATLANSSGVRSASALCGRCWL